MFEYATIDRKVRPNHLKEYILKHHEALSQKEVNEYIKDIWIDTEFPEVNTLTWDWLMTQYKPTHKLKKPITIYRGTSPFNKRMWSWTTNRGVAEYFAHRNYGFLREAIQATNPDVPVPSAYVLKGTIDPEGILFCTNARQEKEVVINGKNHWIKFPKQIQTVNKALWD